MVVIGFDPGSIRFGVGILKKDGKDVRYIHSEEIKLFEKEFNARMKQLWKQLDKVFGQFQIDQAAVEEGYLGKNIQSMNTLAKVRGVILGYLLHRGLDCSFYSPRQVKQAVTGKGNAQKFQVKKMIQILLGLKQKELGDDESDALAVAYCHLTGLR
jgi:crossover junction endodeoxyribonuclease RuvC